MSYRNRRLPPSSLRLFCGAALAASFLGFAGAPAAWSQPVWTQIEVPGASVEYFRYGSPLDGSVLTDRRYEAGQEQWWADKTTTTRPPYAYQWSTLPDSNFSVTRSSCQIVHQPSRVPYPIYWVGLSGGSVVDYSGQYPSAVPNEFHVSEQVSGIHGLEFLGSFSQAVASSRGAYGEAIETVYLTDRRCTDGGREYGFAHYLVLNDLRFYYSDYTNCGAAYCNSQSNAAGIGLDTIADYVSLRNLAGYWDGTQTSYQFYYHAWFVNDNTMKVEALNPQTFQPADCTIYNAAGSQIGPSNVCSATISLQSFFNQGGVVNGGSGYVISGTQQANAGANIPAGAQFSLQEVKVGK
jgi:hypothetical protein